MNRLTGRFAAPILAILFGFTGILRAQASAMPNVGKPSSPFTQSSKEAQPKNLLPLEELRALDVKFQKEMEAAQDAFDREAFSEAEQGFAQLTQEIEDTIRKIAASTLPKNSFIETDGVKKPATIQTETEWYTRTLDKAKRKKEAASILQNVTGMQKQGMALMTAGKYPDDLDAYRKSLQALTENRPKLDDAMFQFYSARSENGQKESSADYWGSKFRALRDQYNRTTEEPRMSQEEIRGTIKAVADEIATQGYTDAAKFPEMPDDARSLFGTLLSAANQYLAAAQ
jgi:cytochrome c556